eukprot:COSAG02_NODE_559_length_20335_cov_10.631894_3_plen_155_part_00
MWLLHPDADAALAGEYGLCKGEGVGMKSLDHFPTMDWWAKESPGRTAIVIDDWPLQTLSVTGMPGRRSVTPGIRPYARCQWHMATWVGNLPDKLYQKIYSHIYLERARCVPWSSWRHHDQRALTIQKSKCSSIVLATCLHVPRPRNHVVIVRRI